MNRQRTGSKSRTVGYAAAAAFALAFAPGSAKAQTTTLDFSSSTGCAAVESGPYGGFTFGGLRQSTPISYGGGCAATNSGTFAPASFFTRVGGGAFTFESAVFGGAFPTPSAGPTLTVMGTLNGVTVFQSMLMPGASNGMTILFAPSGNRTIDTFSITQPQGSNPFFIDNLTTTIATTVPEPSTWVLMAAGLLALGTVARRRRTA